MPVTFSTLFGASLLGAIVVSAVAEPLPIGHFSRHAAYDTVKISPDGAYLATLAPQGDVNALVVIDREKMRVTGSVRVDLDQAIGEFFWANDERIVAQILSRDSDSDRLLDYGEVFAMDADGGSKKLLFGYRVGEMTTGTKIKSAESAAANGQILDRLPDDDKHILIVSYPFSGTGESTPTVFRLNVRRGTKTSVTRTPLINGDVVGDEEAMFWVASGEKLNGDTEVQWRDEERQDWMPLLTVEGVRDQFQVVAVDASAKAVYALSNRNAKTVALVRVDAVTGTETRLVSDDKYDAGWVIRDRDGRTVIGACFESETRRCDYIDAAHPTARLHASLSAAFPGQLVAFESWTRSGDLSVLRVSGPRTPGDFFLFDARSKKVGFLLSSRDWLDPNALALPEPITFDARDGRHIEGYVTRPVGAAEAGPTVVMVHGGPHYVRDVRAFDPEVQLLANRGYTVLQVNYRGSGGYGRDHMEAGFQAWGTRIQDDITDGVRFAIDQGWTDPERICIYGASFGGFSAIMSAAREPDLYRCAVANVGVYDLALMFESGDIPDSRGGPEYLKTVLGTDPESLRAQSPVHHVDAIKATLLIAYGKRDDRAPPEQSTRLMAALEKANVPFQQFVARREGHGFVDEETRARWFEALVTFFGDEL